MRVPQFNKSAVDQCQWESNKCKLGTHAHLFT